MIDVYWKNRLLVSYVTDESVSIDLSKYLADNHQIIRAKVVSFHEEANGLFFQILKKKKNNENYLAGILPNSFELSPFKSNNIYLICLRFALNDIESKYSNYKKICYGYNLENLNLTVGYKYYFKKLYEWINNNLLSYLKLIIIFINILLVKGIKVNEGKRAVDFYKSIFIEYYLNFEIKDILGKKKFFSRQTTNFIDSAEVEESTCRIQLHTKNLPFYKINQDLNKNFKEVENMYSIYQFSTAKEKTFDLLKCIQLHILYNKIINSLPSNYKYLFHNTNKIHNLYIDYFNLKSMQRAISKFNGQNIYCVSECQNWEFGLINFLSKQNDLKIKALKFYVHAPIRSWDLRFHTIHTKFKALDLEKNLNFHVEYLLISGADLNYFKSLNLNKVICQPVKALRYYYLNSEKFFHIKKNTSDKYVVGVIFDYSDLNANQLICLIKRFLEKFSDSYEFIAKFHPANNQITRNRANIIMREFDGIMSDFLRNCNIVICSSGTSSSVDVKYYGINCITFLRDDGLNLNLFDNLMCDTFCNEDDLFNKLEHYKFVPQINDGSNNPLGLYV